MNIIFLLIIILPQLDVNPITPIEIIENIRIEAEETLCCLQDLNDLDDAFLFEELLGSDFGGE